MLECLLQLYSLKRDSQRGSFLVELPLLFLFLLPTLSALHFLKSFSSRFIYSNERTQVCKWLTALCQFELIFLFSPLAILLSFKLSPFRFLESDVGANYSTCLRCLYLTFPLSRQLVPPRQKAQVSVRRSFVVRCRFLSSGKLSIFI